MDAFAGTCCRALKHELRREREREKERRKEVAPLSFFFGYGVLCFAVVLFSVRKDKSPSKGCLKAKIAQSIKQLGSQEKERQRERDLLN